MRPKPEFHRDLEGFDQDGGDRAARMAENDRRWRDYEKDLKAWEQEKKAEDTQRKPS